DLKLLETRVLLGRQQVGDFLGGFLGLFPPLGDERISLLFGHVAEVRAATTSLGTERIGDFLDFGSLILGQLQVLLDVGILNEERNPSEAAAKSAAAAPASTSLGHCVIADHQADRQCRHTDSE